MTACIANGERESESLNQNSKADGSAVGEFSILNSASMFESRYEALTCKKS